ncbi:flagellar basal-body rod modification protein FlgD [Polynucleobacter meluiroseus]|jgi:flagellar basal-body rod modification protein FlgD|uniref:Basal-body rod modification protein FlgD n=1 Tax=Polynucleobacter meluiroseus TaxID=1938814 RepID=A0A240E0H4_9BURK|nr:flagellar hook assembly protein FlgD [Polynucleobacter meluiroseus]MBT8540020.1 flagellar hook assembly protein FlgD [Polynucleobacter paneuropaeus]MBT8575272.1 flagellar hook assembly protein FlgD [Polynucleobacter paneuropaeus]MBT8580127.1 flagellar hook assembly protein FlgD [Polynucleobacter paneuropaeus]QWD15050.1 flagellar hook assembly protein FlgD [Polynucleobacter paneuropaeus]SNX28370.1 flagellar basal-body rod modification protein FlgD [Polynucleobacter meluiroseus]
MTTIQNNPSVTTLPSATNNSSAAGSASAAISASASSASQIQDQFMTLLVAQMKYQDPTNPMNSAEMTSQMAQISTVDGVNKLNGSMNSLLTQMQTNEAYQASSMVGKSVMVPGNTLNLTKGQANFGVQLSAPASSLKVNVLNAAGQTVNVLTYGAEPAGTVPLSWNGKDAAGNQLPDGKYTFQLAANVAGQNVNPTGLTVASVTGILNPTANTSTQIMLDNNTTTNISNVAQIR